VNTTTGQEAPPSFTSTQIKLWQSALTLAFIQPHSIASHQKLLQPVTIWHSLSHLQDWLYFFSPIEDHLYRKNKSSWKMYTYHSGAIRNRRYTFSDQICPTKPPSANRLASISPRTAPMNDSDLIIIALENHTQWQYKAPDDDLTTYDPTEGPFRCSHDAFNSSITSEKILLDAIVLPKDNCRAISIAIQNGTARAISDGSYDLLTLNRIPVIRYLPLRVTLIFANKNHALNTLKMGPLLRNNLILP
jgi:hypothetical protein